MSSPPDFLGFALSQIAAQRNQREQAQERAQLQAQRAQEMEMQQARFKMQMDASREERRQQGLSAALNALEKSGGDVKLATSILEASTNGDFPSAYLDVIKGTGKVLKEKAQIPSEATQNDIASGLAAGMGTAEGQMAAIRNAPEGPPEYTTGLLQRAGAIAAENARQDQLFKTRQHIATTEQIRQFGAQRAILARENFGNFLMTPEAAAKAGFQGIPTKGGLVAVTAENLDEQRKAKRAGGVMTGAAAGIATGGESLGTTPAVQTQAQQDILSLQSVRDNLVDLKSSTKPEYFGYYAQGRAEVLKQYQLLGGAASPQADEFLSGFDKWNRLKGQDAMDATFYYLRSTFTDKATQKVDSLRLNIPLTPAQFNQRVNDLIELSNREIARRNYLLKQGFITDPDPKGLTDEQKAALDQQVSVGKVGGQFYGSQGAQTIEEIMARRYDELHQVARTRGMDPGPDREAWVRRQLAQEFGIAQ